jgi:uncharacterized protein (DUF58 family)
MTTGVLRDKISDWISRPRFPEAGAVHLSQRRVYILPTRAGLGFGAVLMLTLAGSINYTLSLGFILTFLLAGMAIVSILHTYRNLAHLRVSPGRATEVFAGQTVLLPVHLDNPTSVPRVSVGLQQRDGSFDYVNISAGGSAMLMLGIVTRKRGYLKPGRFSLFTRYPVGLTRAWCNLDFGWSCLVYPAPEVGSVPPPSSTEPAHGATASGLGDEEFAGLRGYQPGDSPRRIAWKSSARSDLLLTKQFSGSSHPEVWLDWHSTAGCQTVEARLSRLTRWVLDAESTQTPYGIRLPGMEIAPGLGPTHRNYVLGALALFDS